MSIFSCFDAEDSKFLRRKAKVRLSENKSTKIRIMIDVLNMVRSSNGLGCETLTFAIVGFESPSHHHLTFVAFSKESRHYLP